MLCWDLQAARAKKPRCRMKVKPASSPFRIWVEYFSGIGKHAHGPSAAGNLLVCASTDNDPSTKLQLPVTSWLAHETAPQRLELQLRSSSLGVRIEAKAILPFETCQLLTRRNIWKGVCTQASLL